MSCSAVVDEEADSPAPKPINYVSDLTKIHAELGWKPTVGIDEGLKTLF
jgi:hypothetical protein